MQNPVDLKSLLAGGWPAEAAAQQRVARTLFDRVEKLCHAGYGPKLHKWLQQLPPAVRDGNPLLGYTEAACLACLGDHEAARQLASKLWAAATKAARSDNSPPLPRNFAAKAALLTIHCAVMTGRYAEALQVAAESEHGCDFTADQRTQLLAECCTAEYFLGHYERAMALGKRIIDLTDFDPYVHTQAIAYVAAMQADLCRFAEAEQLLRQAEAALSRFPYAGLQCLVLAAQAHVRIVMDDPVAALRLTERGLPLATDAEQAHARVMLLLVHARALGLLGRWAEVAAVLRELDASKMARWNQCRLETAWALYDASTGNRDLALQRIPRVLAALSGDATPGETWTLLELAEAADIANAPALADLLDQLHKLVPPVHIAGRARLAWLTAKHIWRSGESYSGPLAQFVSLCEQHQLTGILGRAAREAPHIFLDGLKIDIASPLYAAALPPLSDHHIQQLAELLASPGRPASVRHVLWQCLARYPEHEATLEAATALACTDAAGLGTAARRLLESVKHRGPIASQDAVLLQTFGDFELTYRGRTSAVPWRRKAQVLLVLLLSQHPRPLPRVTAQELLWPDLGQEAAANNLRVVIHSLRRSIAGLLDGDRGEANDPPLAVVNAGDALSLRGAEWVQWDAPDFAAYVATARRCMAIGDPTGAISAYTHALALYRGPYLAHRVFDKAFALDREHYAHLAHETTLELAALHLDHGDPLQALRLAEQAIESDPLDEIAHQLVMRAQTALGYPHRAAAAFARFQALAAETGTTPDGSTERLLQQLLHGHTATAGALNH